MNYQDQINNQIQKPKNYKKVILVSLLVFILAVLLISGYYLFTGSSNENESFKIDEEEQILARELANWQEFESENIIIEYPPGYSAEERGSGHFVIFKNENKELGEAGIEIYEASSNNLGNYDEIVATKKRGLDNISERNLERGIKVYGIINEGLGQGLPLLFSVIELEDQVILIESSGEIINEAIFDAVVSRIKAN